MRLGLMRGQRRVLWMMLAGLLIAGSISCQLVVGELVVPDTGGGGQGGGGDQDAGQDGDAG
jgi:hypothetical protein